MNIRIVQRPIGEAPEWVRDAWIGVSLPTASALQRDWRGFGVLTGPHHWLAQIWALLCGNSFTVKGYAVNAKIAVDRLADHSPEAAAWWREHAPLILNGKRNFVFDSPACEREP